MDPKTYQGFLRDQVAALQAQVAALQALTATPSWTTVPSFTNSWSATADTPKYAKVGSLVMLGGAATGGTANTSAFTLPSGFHPITQRGFFIVASSGTTVNAVLVGTDGTVVIVSSATTWLSGISFLAI